MFTQPGEGERSCRGGGGWERGQDMPGLSRAREKDLCPSSSSFARRGCHLTPFGSSCHARAVLINAGCNPAFPFLLLLLLLLPQPAYHAHQHRSCLSYGRTTAQRVLISPRAEKQQGKTKTKKRQNKYEINKKHATTSSFAFALAARY